MTLDRVFYPVLDSSQVTKRRISWLTIAALATFASLAGGFTAWLTTAPLPSFNLNFTQLVSQKAFDPTFYQLTRPVNILILGIDRQLGINPDSPAVLQGRSDTILLIQFNPQTKKINLLSIPRDSQVTLAGIGITKINEANVVGGVALTKQVVSEVLNGVKIDGYVRVNTDAFRELVDLLDGVDLSINQPMVYQDKTQKLTINLAPGWQTLNGEQAQQFARFRHDGLGDIGRVKRQQILLKALLDRALSSNIIPEIPRLIRLLEKYVDTDLDFPEMMTLANFSIARAPADFHTVILPGTDNNDSDDIASYWLINQQESREIIDKYFTVDSR